MIETCIFEEVYKSMYRNISWIRPGINEEVDDVLLQSILLFGYVNSMFIGMALHRKYNWTDPTLSQSWSTNLVRISDTINSITSSYGDYDRLV